MRDRRESLVFHYAPDGSVASFHSPLTDTLRCSLCSSVGFEPTIGTCRNCGVTIYRLSERDPWKHGDASSGDVRCMGGYAEPWPIDADRFCVIERETQHTIRALGDGICPVCRKPRRLREHDF